MARFDDLRSLDAVASRILLAVDDADLSELVAHERLLTHAPELRPVLEHLHRHTPDRDVFARLSALLEAPAVAGSRPLRIRLPAWTRSSGSGWAAKPSAGR